MKKEKNVPRCTMPGCKESLDMDSGIELSEKMAYPCSRCGRVHFLGENGPVGAVNQDHRAVYLFDGRLICSK